MSIPNNTKSLGRGLSSLIGAPNSNPNNNLPPITAPYLPKIKRGSANQILFLPLSQIKTNPYQPRESFDETALQELTASIKEHGIIQPLIVTETLAGNYELIAGERRLRAANLAGLKEVPVIVRSAKELEKLELSLIENIQRQDLNPMEKAESYKKLIDEFGLSHDDAARRLGISRPQFSNTLRLLTLPTDIQTGLANNKISLSQAKVILEVKDNNKRQQLYHRAVQTEMTVTDVKKEADKIKVHGYTREIKKDPVLREMELRLQEKLNTKVAIRKRGAWGGIIQIEFYSDEELAEIINRIA